MSFLRPLESFIGMFQGLLGMLVSSLVIFFPVVCGGNAVRVCGELVEFGSSLVRVVWHGVSLGFRCILDSFHFPRCPIRDTGPRACLWQATRNADESGKPHHALLSQCALREEEFTTEDTEKA
jgi:hypothetical protein